MAERSGHDRSVQFEHAFDRLLAAKLEQGYGILVPERVRAIGADQSVRGKRDEGCRDLRQSIFGAAEGGEHDRLVRGNQGETSTSIRMRTCRWVCDVGRA